HIADWVVVMAEGRVVAEGPPESVMKEQAVIDAYLGAHQDVDLGVVTGRHEGELSAEGRALAEGAEEIEAAIEADADAHPEEDARCAPPRPPPRPPPRSRPPRTSSSSTTWWRATCRASTS